MTEYENAMRSSWLILGILFAAAAVGIGAFGAHGLKKHIAEEQLAIFEIGVRYQMYHALGLIAVAIWSQLSKPAQNIRNIGICFSLGILIFSGSLYTLAMTDVKMWGMVTPVGGVLFLIGWGIWARQVSSLDED